MKIPNPKIKVQRSKIKTFGILGLGFGIYFGFWILSFGFLGISASAQTVSIINYPNPFNPKGGEIVTFECRPDETQNATLYLYDLSARLLWQKDFNLQGGTVNRITWNGYSDFNELVGNGIYLYRLVDSSTKKMAAKGKVWVINQ